MADGTSDTNEPTVDASEPSMEDILASIRQLIADDGDKKANETLSAGDALPNVDDAEPLELNNIINSDGTSPEALADDLLSGFRDDKLGETVDGIDIPDIPKISEVADVQLVDDIDGLVEELTLNDSEVSIDVPAAKEGAELLSADQDEVFSLDNLLDDVVFGDPPAEEVLETDAPDQSMLNHNDTEIDALANSAAETPTAENISDDAEIDSLISDLAAENDDAGEPEPIIESLSEELISDEIASDTPNDLPQLDDLLADESLTDDVLTASPEPLETDADITSLEELLDADEDEVLSEPNADVEALEAEAPEIDKTDPDIELVKSLMAELSSPETLADSNDMDSSADMVDIDELLSEESIDDNLAVSDDTLAIDEALDLDLEEDDFLADLLDDNIIATENAAPQQIVQSKSSLAVLAEKIETEDKPAPSGANTKFAGVLGGVAAAMATVPAASALGNLLNEETDATDMPNMDDVSVESDDILSDIVDEASVHIETKTDHDDSLEALLPDEPEAVLKQDVPDDHDVALDEDSDEKDLDAALDALLDGVPLDADDEPEDAKGKTDVSDVISDILEETSDDSVDETDETVDIILETSQTEIEDMARKAANSTILDEVTETAAASAFASLTSVVEEKAVVAERGDRIGDLVSEALQPMLKEWLDKNLKGIVERAVTKEVKRISTGK